MASSFWGWEVFFSIVRKFDFLPSDVEVLAQDSGIRDIQRQQMCDHVLMIQFGIVAVPTALGVRFWAPSQVISFKIVHDHDRNFHRNGKEQT